MSCMITYFQKIWEKISGECWKKLGRYASSHTALLGMEIYIITVVNALLHLVTLDMLMACSPAISFLDTDQEKLLDVFTKLLAQKFQQTHFSCPSQKEI